MRFLSVLLLACALVAAEIVERPVAIIPWSQYQQRMKHQKQYSPYSTPLGADEKDYIHRIPEGPPSAPRRLSQTKEPLDVVDGPSKQARRNQVIRPQIRGRTPTEPADFARQLPQLPQAPKMAYIQQPNPNHIQYPPAPQSKTIPRMSPLPNRFSKSFAAVNERDFLVTGDRNNVITKMKMTPTSSRISEAVQEPSSLPIPSSNGLDTLNPVQQAVKYRSSIGDIQIPNGVPMHAGNWENNKPNYISERRPAQHAVSNIAGIDPAIPLAGLRSASSVVDGSQFSSLEPAGNIVNSIFSQSNAQGIQSIPNIPNAQPNAIESFLANSGNLDAISKITKNLLNVGGEPGREAGLLDIMANALKRTSLPFGSAHDETATLEASAPPKATLMERLINQATSALHTSIKENEKKEQEKKLTELKMKDQENQLKLIEEEKKKENELIAPTMKPISDLPDERINSLKLLENLPTSQREILEAAIRSGEIDEDGLAPAIGVLVSGDNTEDSRKEKESRLREWIRANRPVKQKEFNVTSDKLPYFGRYCGTFVPEKASNSRFDATGGVWMADERHLIVSKFHFKPVSFLSDLENVTFWIGPKESTSNAMLDQMPSANGFYVQPSKVDVSIFALEKASTIQAKPRNAIPAAVMLNGTPPIEALKGFKPLEELRLKRQVTPSVLLQDEMPPTYVPAPIPKKPVELLVKDGVVRILDGDRVEQINSSFSVNRSLAKGEITSEIPPGAHLRQPEYDSIDYSIPQPLGWYEGFQPLLLTLPEGRKVSDVKWISLRDHNRQETVVSLMMPNDPNFSPPAPVTVRPLSSNGLFNVSSGSIHIHDMKTMEIKNFTLRTNGDSVWFMIGRDILPNLSGHIVPLYDPVVEMFDCESLRDYYGETIQLRIPGQLDMRDVFWFSVFSPSKGLSYSHLYLPYDHLRLPPDLKGTPTATCKYSP